MDTLLDYNARLIEGKKMALCLRELKNVQRCNSCSKRSSSVRVLYFKMIENHKASYISGASCKRCIENGCFTTGFLIKMDMDCIENFTIMFEEIKETYYQNSGILEMVIES